MTPRFAAFLGAGLLALTFTPAVAAPAAGGLPSDVPAHFTPSVDSFDYVRREVMIPMRDGVKLHTVIVIPKGATRAPIILERTPYNASMLTSMGSSSHIASIMRPVDELYVKAGYIRVYQDVRGKHGSEGDYVSERPLRGPANPTDVDHATDAYDAIDWLVKNVPETNGRVGMVGNSYDGMMVLMALADPHPALKAAVPGNPVANTWMGDDDFHGGAFRMVQFDYHYMQDSGRGQASEPWRDAYDDYDNFLTAGSAGDFARNHGLEQLGFVRRLIEHPAYDASWKARALETVLAQRTPTVPTLLIASQWDQEDSYGAIAVYEAVKSRDVNHLNHLVLGPWSHGGWQRDGASLGAIRFDSDTALWFRTRVLLPFLDEHLKERAAKADTPPVLVFETGTNTWKRYADWPRSCASACSASARPLYLQAGARLGFSPPAAGGEVSDDYVSDPAKPVPYRVRPIRPMHSPDSTWSMWLADDQRAFSDRPDVLTYMTEPLSEPVAIAGAPVVNLVAATSGTDSDWVVKLIDVYPQQVVSQPELGGYQLAIAMDIMRGRYREGYDTPKPVEPGKALTYRFDLPHVSHVFLPGHRIMVQVQSSWFPLYDRNPQTFVNNIFLAKPGDYRKASQRIFHSPGKASFVELPIVPLADGNAG